MRKIYLENIDLDELEEIGGVSHKESTLFYNKNTIYKLFDDLTDSERRRKETKVELLGDGSILPITVMPKDKLVYGFLNDRFEGYSMDYISDATTLLKAFTENKKMYLFLYIINIVSQAIEKIHKDSRNIVISDLHAKNIILDKNMNPYIVDIESAKIDGIKNDTIALSLHNYLLNRNLYTNIETTPNTDRLCLLMMALNIIFRKHIDKISQYEYDEKAEQIATLKNMRELVLEIQKSSTIPEVPYIHELIQYSDIFKRSLIK